MAVACFWATIPFGSVSRWATAILSIIGVVLLLAEALTPRPPAIPMQPVGTVRRVCWLSGGLFLWCALSTLPVPSRWLAALQPLATSDYGALFDGLSGHTTLSIAPSDTWSALALCAGYACLGVVSYRTLLRGSSQRRLGWLLAFCGSLQSVWGVATRSAVDGRIAGSFTSGNALGGFLVLTLLPTLGLLLSQAERFKLPPGIPWRRGLAMVDRGALARALALLAVSLLQATALALTGSRGAILCGVGASLFLLVPFARLHRRIRSQHVWVLPAVLLALLLGLAWTGGYTATMDRFRSLIGASDSSLMCRTAIWSGAWRLCLEHPMGLGLGGFSERFLGTQLPGFGMTRAILAHNDWLQLLCELGLPGWSLLMGLIWCLASPFRHVPHTVKADAPAWYRRSIILALGATLAHALVDFNLTSRPGVATTFAVLTGAALAASTRLHAKSQNATGQPLASDSGTLRIVPRAAVALALLALAVREARIGSAAWLADSGFIAAGGKLDAAIWSSPVMPDLPTGRAQLLRAATLAPGDGTIPYRLAVTMFNDFERRQNEATQTNAMQLHLPVGVAWRGVRTAMRAEELGLCQDLEPLLDQAVKLRPWDPDIHALRGHLLLTQWANAGGRTERPPPSEALQELDLAAQLAPTDATTLQQLCATLARALDAPLSPDARRACALRLWRWGRQAWELPGAEVSSLLWSWHVAGFPHNRLAQWPSVPLETLNAYYMTFGHGNDEEFMLAVLDRMSERLQTALANGTRSPERQRSWMKERSRFFLAERLRLTLRLGHWERYRALSPERLKLFSDHAIDATHEAAAGKQSAALARLMLKKVDARSGLPPSRRLERVRLESRYGELPTSSELLAETALMRDGPTAGDWSAFLASPPPLMPGDYALPLAQARASCDLGLPSKTVDACDKALACPALPPRFRHAIQSMRAQALLIAGDAESARTALLAAARDSPANASLLRAIVRALGPAFPVTTPNGTGRAIDRLTAVTPPYGLGRRYWGGGAVLDGFDVVHDSAAAGPLPRALRTYWTFYRAVPPSLSVQVAALNANGQTITSRLVSFTSADPLAFAAGAPRVGETLVLSIPVPPVSQPDATLAIVLLDRVDFLPYPADEGTPLELGTWRQITKNGTAPTGSIPTITLTGLSAEDEVRVRAAADACWPPSTSRGVTLNAIRADTDPHSGFPLGDLLGASGYALHGTGADAYRLASASPEGLLQGMNEASAAAGGDLWMLPDERFRTKGPQGATTPAGSLWRLEAPAFTVRAVSTGPAWSTNRSWQSTWALTGTANLGLTHNAHGIFQPDRNFTNHPGWFPELGGMRPCPTNDDWQPCLSSSGLVDHAVDVARTFFSSHPTNAVFALGINDSSNWCECAACAALLPVDDRATPASLRWWSEPYWEFVNTVADRITRDFPHARFGALAYAAVQMPPSFPVHDAVTVFLCQDSSTHFDPVARALDRTLLKTWCRRAKHLARYDYPGLTSWMFPRYGADEFQADLQTACKLGVRTYHVEDFQLSSINGPMSWLEAQWLWNPWLPQEGLERLFCARAFGSAGPAMQAYFGMLQAQWDSAPQGIWLDGFKDVEAQARRYPLAVLDRLEAQLAQARRDATGDADARARIAAISDPLRLSRALAREVEAFQAGRREDLSRAVAARRELLQQEANSPWGQEIREAPTWQATLARWDAKVASLLGAPAAP